MLIGGLAVRALALPRATYDIDVVVGIGEEGVSVFALAAEAAGFEVPEPHLRRFADTLAGLRKISIRVPVGEKSVVADIFIAATDYQRAAYSRRRPDDSVGVAVTVCSAEDLLIHKLLASRHRDLSDVADLLLVTGPLDGPYLRRWAGHFWITDRLDLALREAGRSD